MTQKLSSPKTSFLNWLKHFQAQFCSGHQVQPSHYGLYRLWRIWFVTQRTTNAESGFILPTVTLLLLMVSLIIGLLVSRTYSRTTEVAGDRRQTVLYNSVTPAIDRAKAKLEYLFTEASLPPLPSDLDLSTELSDTKYNLSSQNNASKETRMDVNGDGTLDNAWIYTTDLDGDGETETVAYSILSNAVAVDDKDTSTVSDDVTYNLESTVNKNKAQALVVRNGPINLKTSDASTCANAQTSPYAGWESVDSSELRKALQVHAIVLEDTNSDNPISATLEMQQDRVANLGNRWAAWFRYDLGANPGAGFRMNGAIHTEGNFFLTSDLVAYLVSSPNSCVYSASASEISMAQINKANGNQQRFQGQLLINNPYEDDPTQGNILVDRFTSSGPTGDLKANASGTSAKANDRIRITNKQDTGTLIRYDSTTITTSEQLRLNPIALFTQGISESMGSDRTNFSYRDPDWKEDNKLAVGSGDGGRIFNNNTPIPFLDDTYRADDRWGPKPLYTDTLVVPDGSLGNTIPSGTLELLQNDPLVSTQPDEEAFGFDGYWERRARRAGVRLIVGQRLELGNASEWLYEDLDSDGVLDSGEDTNGNGYLDVDPLYPPRLNAYAGTNMAKRGHEMRQWKTLRDNLAAVQSAAVYHYKSNNGSYPVACLAATAHPGTIITDRRSRTVNTATVNETLIKLDVNGDGDQADTAVNVALVDFYNILTNEDADGDGVLDTGEDKNGNGRLDAPGQGTNGFEFAPPFAGNATTFATQIDEQFDSDATYTPLGVALTNLAYFAGDPAGAFPPQQDSAAASATNAAKTQANFATADAVGVVHPYPALTMWGNFSELRAVINKLQSGTTYSQLSIADQSTLHTATCTLGMLAYGSVAAETSVKLEAENFTISSSLDGNINSFAVEADKMMDASTSNGWLGNYKENLGSGLSVDWNGDGDTDDTGTHPNPASYVNYATSASDFFKQLLDPNSAYYTSQGITFSSAEKENFAIKRFAAAMEAQSGGGAFKTDASAVLNDLLQMAQLVQLLSISELDRDRQFGFVEGVSGQTFAPAGYEPKTGAGWWSPSSGTAPYGAAGGAGSIIQVGTGCDPYIFMDPSGPLGSVKDSSETTVDLSLGTTGGDADKGIALATAICSSFEAVVSYPKFPALYYLFPSTAHQHDGTKKTGVTGGTQVMQTTADAYVSASQNPYIFDRANSRGVNRGLNFEVVEDTGSIGDGDGVKETGESLAEFVAYLGMTPRDPSTPDWATPVTNTGTRCVPGSLTAGCRANQIIYNGTSYYPAFQDIGMFNGRELMSVRTLSIDLDLLRQTQLNNVTGGCTYDDPESMAEYNADNNGKCWLPLPTLVEKNGGTTTTNAIIYAFREDAVREDAIARPTRPDASNLTCANFTQWTTQFRNHVNRDRNGDGNTSPTDTNSNGIINEYDPVSHNQTGLDITDMLMDATGITGGYYDPPVNPCTKISPKPVDFYNDPDRRPHGFVLRNGKDLRRKRTSGTNSFTGTAYDYSPRGMSFISDQPVYIWGDFNYHSDDRTVDAAANDVQEFTTALATNWSNFYSRTTLNNDFVDYGDVDKDNKIDTWRPVEILADATTILSNGFNPGFIEDGLLWNWQGSDSTRSNQTTRPAIAGVGDSTRNSYGNIRVLRTIEKPPENTSADNSLQADTKDEDHNSISPAKRVNPALWVREDGTITATLPGHSPIKLDRNGFPIYRRYEDPDTSPTDTSYDLSYYADVDLLGDTNSTPDPKVFVDVAYGTNSPNAIERTRELFESPTFDNSQYGARRRIQTGIDTTINAVFVSAVSPFRINHSNGGLHNFLRLTETWGSGGIDEANRGTVTDLNFRGSLIQLNFSVYSGAQTHNELEPGQDPGNDGSKILYYHEADRLWGYDPALIYAPAAPAARRFASPGKTRSEFYRELATDDPYILNLRCASYDSDGNGTLDKKVDPSASCQ